MTAYYSDARHAVNFAALTAPQCVGYRQGKGWFVYSPLDGCPADCEPELFIAAQGTLPLPLTEVAMEVWLSIVRASVSQAQKLRQ